jgi:hypothetical protein
MVDQESYAWKDRVCLPQGAIDIALNLALARAEHRPLPHVHRQHVAQLWPTYERVEIDS